MKISEIVSALGCTVLCGEDNLDCSISTACGADLMSDVLAFAKENCVLLTGMVNHHVIRTAQMLDINCIVFVRSKLPADDVCVLANEAGVTLLSSTRTLYEACGILYSLGLPPC